MIQLISREEVYYKSWLVDHFISDIQRSYYDQFGYNLDGYLDDPDPEDPYDHLDAFHHYKEELDDFAVLGYTDRSKTDFLNHRSNAFIRLFERLDIKRLFLLDEFQCDWIHFPFKSREKLNEMKQIVNQSSYTGAFELDIDDLIKILPLFNFSGRHSQPIIWFFSANSQVPIATFLCDDGNFHTSFLPNDREKITSEVLAAGLVIGGLEICRM